MADGLHFNSYINAVCAVFKVDVIAFDSFAEKQEGLPAKFL